MSIREKPGGSLVSSTKMCRVNKSGEAKPAACILAISAASVRNTRFLSAPAGQSRRNSRSVWRPSAAAVTKKENFSHRSPHSSP